MAKNLSSTNITELLEAQLNAIKDIESVVIKANINSATLRVVGESLRSVEKVLGSLSTLFETISKFKLYSPTALIKNKLAIKALTSSIEGIIGLCKYINENKDSINVESVSNITIVVNKIAEISKAIAVFTLASGFGLLFIGATAALVALKGFLFILSLLFNRTTIKIMNNADRAIRSMSMTILLLSSSIVMIVLTGVLIAESAPIFLVITGYLLFITNLFLMISLIVQFMKEVKLDKGIMYIALTITALSLSTVMLVLAGQLITEEWQSLLMVSAYLLVLVGAFTIIGWASKGGLFEKGNKEMFFIAATVAILSSTVVILAFAGKIVDDNEPSIKNTVLLLGVLVGALIGVAYASKFIEVGNKTMLKIAGTMAVIVGSLFALSLIGDKLSWNSVLITLSIIGGIAGIAVALGIPAVAAFATAGATILLMLSGVIIAISASLFIITKVIEKVREMGLTEEDTHILSLPVKSITDVCKTVNDQIGAKDLAKATVKMLSLAFIAGSLGRVAKVLSDIAALRMPTEFDKNGNPIAWHSMDSKDFANAATSAAAITKLLVSMFGESDKTIVLPDGTSVTISPISLKELDNISNRTKRKIRQLSKITASVGQMATVIQNIASLSVPISFDKDGKPTGFQKMTDTDFATASTNLATIVTTILTAVTSDELTEQLDNMSRKSRKNLETVINSCSSIGGIVDAIKSVSVMSVADEFDGNGNPTHYKILTDTERTEAQGKIVDIMTFFMSAIASDSMTEVLNGFSKKSLQNIDRVMESCKGISELVSTIKKATEFDVTVVENGINNLKVVIADYSSMIDSLFTEQSHYTMAIKESVMGTQTTVLSKVVDSEALINTKIIEKSINNFKKIGQTVPPIVRLMKDLNKVKIPAIVEKNPKTTLEFISKYVNTVGKIEKFNERKIKANVENLTKFIDKSNNINIDKIKSVTELFAEIAKFSESIDGNFEKLADVLNDKVIDALNKISNKLSGVNSFGGYGFDFNDKQPENKAVVGNSDAENSKTKQNSVSREIENLQQQIEDIITAVNGIHTILKEKDF